MDENHFRQIIREELEPVKKELTELSENVDAARGDIETIRMIDEIKTHLHMPLMPDTPEV